MSGLRELLNAASPGEWLAFQDEYGWHVENGLAEYSLGHGAERLIADAHLIALAPQMAELLLDMADALRLIDHSTLGCEGECVASRKVIFEQIHAGALLARYDNLVVPSAKDAAP